MIQIQELQQRRNTILDHSLRSLIWCPFVQWVFQFSSCLHYQLITQQVQFQFVLIISCPDNFSQLVAPLPIFPLNPCSSKPHMLQVIWTLPTARPLILHKVPAVTGILQTPPDTTPTPKYCLRFLAHLLVCKLGCYTATLCMKFAIFLTLCSLPNRIQTLTHQIL
jgi:hypothetical protein